MNILTFDIEEWWIYDLHSQYGTVENSLSRLNNYLEEILDLLDSRKYKATFFCIGEVAQNYPNVIRKIASRGHHIGCHSNSHRFLGDLTPKEFAQDTRLALDRIEDVIGVKVDAYRAPAFSITSNTTWAFEILAELGIEYDCSIFPAYHRYGGYPSFKIEKPLIIHYKDITIKEFPIPLTVFLGKRFAFSGGGYFRLLPYSFIKKAINTHNYNMTYFHIRDFDTERAKQILLSKSKMSPINYFKNLYGISGAYSKFNKLINDFEFISLKDAAETIDWQKVTKVRL